MRVRFHPEAVEEYRAAALHYEKRQPGLGRRFAEKIEEAIRQLSETPRRWRILEENIRRYLVHLFPYAILYAIEGDIVYIIAVMHCHRKPDYWRERMSK
ncbi:MAG: type II toxin-antitoxin system RelE/ParE family toxin [Methylacidiphilales bacterium]|nr:type II toxin-antitoxin system RelE/ParE family toxin [Candidatus Methylacidiphilales bacterium]